MTSANTANENRHLGDLTGKILRFAGIPGVFVLVLGAVLTWRSDLSWERFLRAYLVAFCFVLSLSLGGLFFTLLHHLTRAGWSVVVRRIAEGLAGNLRWLWILFIPIALGMLASDRTGLYMWAVAANVETDALLQHKEAYLNTTFWLIRAAFYFAVWAGLTHYFLSRSVAQDATGDPQTSLRMQAVAAPGMILYAFTQTFAIIDWVMSLEPHWFSTMFGVYFFAASMCGFMSLLIIVVYGLQQSGRVQQSITVEHFQDMGKLLFAFGIVFWAYIAYSQYMLIWYANIQEETVWFLIRQIGGWGTLTVLLVVGHFAGPFLILLSRYPKRWKGFLTVVAGWMLFMHFIDIYWLVMPAIPIELIESVTTYPELVEKFEAGYRAEYGMHWHIVDFTCLLGLGGLLLAGTAFGLRNRCLIPQRDPRLGESLAFENF